SSTELVRNISRSSNSQNRVTDADFFSTHPFHIRMEQHSRRIYAPAETGAQYETKWFYERAKGQFLHAQMMLTPAKKRQFLLQNPKSKVITKTCLAKVRNTWNEMPHMVSKGAQTNFMKFAELIDGEWTTDDAQFNERYFTETVALVILFKHMESLIPKQFWYEHGYRANIVTYTLALLHKLIRTQFKDMQLDLQNIWLHQSVSDILTSVLEQISEHVFYKITDTRRPTINVTQWCKQESCWKSVQEVDLSFSAAFSKVLVRKSEVKAAEKEAKSVQKVISETDAQVKVLEYSANQWERLSAFARQKRMVSIDENIALRYACQIPNKIPSGYQSQRLLALLERAFSEGFQL
ncbi:MAG TPA: AIPR family protein, partial [Methanocorpusculum sp.]|nr:AIPR family protein [Methanocorpusculum sp.]